MRVLQPLLGRKDDTVRLRFRFLRVNVRYEELSGARVDESGRDALVFDDPNNLHFLYFIPERDLIIGSAERLV